MIPSEAGYPASIILAEQQPVGRWVELNDTLKVKIENGHCE